MSATRLHWHGYTWNGSNTELSQEHLRRPGTTPVAQETQTFLASSLPPVQTGHYLLRRKLVRADRTWMDHEQVLQWLIAEYHKAPPFAHADGQRSYVGLNERVITTSDGLVNGVDAWWQHYTAGFSVIVLAAICCPHRHRTEIPCPLPPV